MFSKLVLALAILSVSGCALFEERKGPGAYIGPREQVFYATYDEVWRAANLVLQPYPLRVSNMDQGVLETDAVRGYKSWTPPFAPESASSGLSYKLTLKLLRGKFNGRIATKVSILKDATVQHDFFSDPKPLTSDGLEEKSLLYRVGREITIERAIAKAQKRHTKVN